MGIKILITDDHALFRSGLISLLKEEKDYFIIGEAENGEELIKKYYLLKPDIIIADISMPVMSGIDALKELIKQGNDVKILFLSMLDDKQYANYIYDAGGYGLLNKNIVKGELLFAINSIIHGNKYFGSLIDEEKIKLTMSKEKVTSKVLISAIDIELTDKEKNILLYISQGLTSNQIAEKMNIGKRTIDSHRQHIMQKCGVNNLPALIKFAIEYFPKENQ
ncbi:MAG: response regulator transcription factor [Syntrophothermus sp.]